jgi:tetratricopeptide (TPR) repeat protein
MTKPPPNNLVVWVTGGAGLAYEVPGAEPKLLHVGEPVEQPDRRAVGLSTTMLSDRHVGFLALLILDREGELPVPSIVETHQRSTIAEHLGLQVSALRRWAERNVLPYPNSIVQALPGDLGGSRTGGPWHLAARNVALYPDASRAWTFLREVADSSAIRKTDPEELLMRAEALLAVNDWVAAQEVLDAALEMFRRRRWRRNDPIYFAILLRIAHVAMQLGVTGGTPQHASNILRSLTKQRLDSIEARIVAGRAYHNAALVWGQRGEASVVDKTLAALQSAEDALRGIQTQSAIYELFRIRGYREVTLSKARAEAKPPSRSQVIKAGTVFPQDKDEAMLRYGQTLLCADDPSRAVEYIRPALESGKLSTAAWVIAERLNTAADWKLGASRDLTLHKLGRLGEKLKRLSFQQQLELVRRQRREVVLGRRRVVTR